MCKIKDDPQKMWKGRIIDMELNYHARPIQKNVGLSRRSPKSFKDWKMLIYVVKSSSRSFCRAWDRVIIGRDDSVRLLNRKKLAVPSPVPRNSGIPRLKSENSKKKIINVKIRKENLNVLAKWIPILYGAETSGAQKNVIA
ncbi:hypothetical protein TNCV_381291 [Trichonephila clavipes]|uniref:Uncharacterized protein n=1 Tax=Trichonephila clavipes TaxID=2585209 RepID=A0A8X6VEG3_TRICX|nr:hypothetical protein TNCV_381291 [Trichonephila clavipes]